MQSERRKLDRFFFRWDYDPKVLIEHRGGVRTGSILDISENGLFLVMSHLVPLNDIVGLSIHVDGHNEEAVETVAKVIHRNEVGLGVRFLDDDGIGPRLLRRCKLELMREDEFTIEDDFKIDDITYKAEGISDEAWALLSQDAKKAIRFVEEQLKNSEAMKKNLDLTFFLCPK